MVIGNAMTASAVALNRLGDEMHDSRPRIEATLALGATAREAAMPTVRRALRSGMITLVDSTKTTGLIFFPGTMVGMLLAGANPTDAVRLQLILLYVLLGSVSIAALVATGLAYRNFFTPAAQLREPDRIPRRPVVAGSTSPRREGSARDDRGNWAISPTARTAPSRSGRRATGRLGQATGARPSGDQAIRRGVRRAEQPARRAPSGGQEHQARGGPAEREARRTATLSPPGARAASRTVAGDGRTIARPSPISRSAASLLAVSCLDRRRAAVDDSSRVAPPAPHSRPVTPGEAGAALTPLGRRRPWRGAASPPAST